jgi:hypothetical protein
VRAAYLTVKRKVPWLWWLTPFVPLVWAMFAMKGRIEEGREGEGD